MPPHPDVLRDLEREIQALLADHRILNQVAPEGLAKVEAILRKTSADTRRGMVADLTQQDHALARQLHTSVQPSYRESLRENPYDATTNADRAAAPLGGSFPTRQPGHLVAARPPIDFAELEQLEDTQIAQVLQHCSPHITLLALAGASHQFVQRITAQLPDSEAKELQRKIQNIGPLRLDDIQRAQQILRARLRRC